jgi:acyl carrier protein
MRPVVVPQRKTRERYILDTPFVAPRNGIESTLALIWADVLCADSVGVNDSFFEFDGDSLLGIEIGARVQLQLGVEVSLRTLFDAPTVAELASYIAAAAV